MSNFEIARELLIGEPTAKSHVAKDLDKLGQRDRVHLVVLAYERGLVLPPVDRIDSLATRSSTSRSRIVSDFDLDRHRPDADRG